jgi:CheY-like chemotaxis protein
VRRRSPPLIFIVDDEAVVAQTLSIILRTEGYNAVWSNDPFAVLTLAQTKRPDLVISDAMTPNLSGIEVAVRITLPFRPTRHCTNNEDNACAKPTGVLEITPHFAKAGTMLDRTIS